MKNTTKSLIIAVSSVVVLVGAFLAVYYLVPSQEEDNNSSTTLDSLSSEHSDEEHYHLIGYSYSDIDKIVVDNSGGEYTLDAAPNDNVQGTAIEDTNLYSIEGFEDLTLRQKLYVYYLQVVEILINIYIIMILNKRKLLKMLL